MKGLDKVLQGVLKFRKTIRKDLVKQFEEVRDNPQPTALFFTCMDSRILPSTVTHYIDKENKLNIEDKLSQINTLQQVLNIASHEFMFDYMANNKVFIHAMWFDIYDGNMYLFSKPEQCFIKVDEKNTDQLLRYVENEMKGISNNHQHSNNCCH
uniref:carbonic anhydrase n=1 Tax=Strongyloides stercoralis TaxID=6248 RepID=A0AAF5DL41_STRER